MCVLLSRRSLSIAKALGEGIRCVFVVKCYSEYTRYSRTVREFGGAFSTRVSENF